jgi:hypothetical protein
MIPEKYKTRINWLLEGDPSIRYHTMRDLLHMKGKEIEDERDRITTEGWGKRLLSIQDPEGTWSGKLYSPKWTSTFYTLLLLKRFGARLVTGIEKAIFIILDTCFYKDGGLNFWKTWKQSETCVTGMFLSILSHFGIDDPRTDAMVRYLKGCQMKDKGWNCEHINGATHSSFHTTLSVLEGLWEYEKFKNGNTPENVRQLQDEGMEFMLMHRLYKSDRTGKVVDPKMTRFSFPPRWRYDVMKGLDYAQDREFKHDERFSDAISLLKDKETYDGFWPLQNRHGGKIFFPLEKVGQPSRWNTLRALRILQWWENKATPISNYI